MNKKIYQSITSPGVSHDEANMLTELIFLNKNIHLSSFPWKDKTTGKEWGKMVSCIKKIIREFEITSDQIAFYIFKCRPINIKGVEFGKMAVVAGKLLRKHDLEDLIRIYSSRREELRTTDIEFVKHKTQKPKSLMQLLKELENGEA